MKNYLFKLEEIGRAMKAHLALFALLAVFMTSAASRAYAAKIEAYAAYDNNKVLTFYYDDQKSVRSGSSTYALNERTGTYSFTVPASDVTINANFKSDVTLTVSLEGWTYGETPNTPVVNKNGTTLTDLTGITITYKDSKGNPVVTPSSTTPAGSYTVTATYAGSECEKTATADADFTIGKATLTVKADEKNKTYGDADPALTYEVTGFKGTDDKTTVLNGELSRATGENAGSYAILQGSLNANENYEIGFTPSFFTIGSAPLTVTADAISKTYGQADPALTYDVNGLKNGDEKSKVLAGNLSREPGEDVGEYEINNNKGSLFVINPNYTIQTVRTNKFTILNGNTVTFVTKYCTAPAKKEHVPNGSTITAPTDGNMTEKGYTFTGKWYTDDKYTTEWDFASSTVSGDMNLYAKWTPITYYFVYDKGEVQECSGTMEPTPFTIESTKVTLRENVYSAKGYYWWRWAVGSIRLENNVTFGSDDISVLIDFSDANNKITLTSVWEYAITYELNDGSWPAGVTPYDRYNDVGLTIQTPTKTGYTFLGWTGSNGTTPETSVIIHSGSKGPVKYTANWKINKYEVTFKDGETTLSGPTELEYQADISMPSNPTKTGYTFDGWDNLPSDGKMPADNLTLTAKWTPITYTLNYKSIGADLTGGSMDATTFTIKDGVTLRKNAFTSDKSFWAGWHTENFEYKFADEEELSAGEVEALISLSDADNQITLFATWYLYFAITYELNGGSLPVGVTNPERYISLYSYTLNSPVRDGYTFDGWYQNSEFSGDVVTEIIENSKGTKHFYAKWTPNQYTITIPDHMEFCDAGGNSISATGNLFDCGSTVYFKASDGYGLKPGSSVEAFTTTPNVTVSENSGIYSFTVPASGVTVQATLKKTVTLAVSLDDWIYGESPNTPTVKKNGTQIDNSSVTITYTDSEGNPVTPSSTTPAGTYTVTASYAGNDYEWPDDADADFKILGKYTVTFHSIHGTAPASLADVVEGSKITAPTDGNMTETGYTFTGKWYTDDKYTTEWNFAESKVTGDMELYAQWTPNQYTIKFNTDGGSEISDFTADFGASVTKPADPTKNGYTFAGWNPVIPATMPVDGLTVNAQWTPNQYTVTLPAGMEFYGNSPADNKFDCNSAVNFKVSDGYELIGDVTTDPNVSVMQIKGIYSFTVPASDVKVLATVKPIVYTISYDLNSGYWQLVPVEEYNVETPDFDLPTPTYHGYTFLGWTGSNGTNPETSVTIDKGSIGNKTFKANWKKERYTVTLPDHMEFYETYPDAEGKFEYGSTVKFKVTDGYELRGSVSTDPDLGTFLARSPNPIDHLVIQNFASDVTVHATVKLPVTLAVSLDDWTYGESPNTPAVTKNGTALTDLTDVTFTYTDSEGNPVTPSSTTPAGTYTVTASYAGNDYEWYATGFADFTIGKATLTVKADPISKTYGQDDPTLTYTADGFKNGENSSILSGSLARAVGENVGQYEITLGALSAGNNYEIDFTGATFTILNGNTVTFHTAYGSVNPEKLVHVPNGSTITAPDDGNMTETGYTFTGKWYTTSNFADGTEWDFSSNTVTGDMDLYAKWSLTEYTITYENCPEDVDNNNQTSYTINDDVTLYLLGDRAGAEFVGWCSDRELNNTISDIAINSGSTGNKTFYAKWNYEYYTIAYNLNGGNWPSDVVPVEEHTVDDDFDFPQPVKLGYTFTGWDNLPSDGKMPADNLTLTAKWELTDYTITFETNGGGAIDPMTYTIESETIDLSTIKPEKEGYHFVKWIDNENAEVTQIVKGSFGNVELTALFEAHSFGNWDTTLVATCAVAGLRTHACACGEVETDTIAALGHKVVTDSSVAATCTATGLTEGKHCSVCDSIFVAQQTIPALGHKIETIAGVSSTCTAEGLTEGSRCSVCGEVIKAQQTIPMLEHSFTNYIYNNDATTEADGTETAVCDHGCGATDIRTAEGTKLTGIAGETANAVAIYAHHNVIVVENADADIYVYDVTGRCIEMRESCPSVEIAMQREGIYIVRTGGKVQRVAVK